MLISPRHLLLPIALLALLIAARAPAENPPPQPRATSSPVRTLAGPHRPPSSLPHFLTSSVLDPGLLAISSPPSAFDRDLTDLFDQAQALQEAGEYEQAGDRYKAIITYAPMSPEAAQARFQLGVIAHTTGNYSNAAGAFTQFRGKHPTHPKANLALFWLAESYRSLGADAEALGAYHEFLKHYPQVEGEVRIRRAEILTKNQDMAAATKELDAATAAGTSPNPDLKRRQADTLVKQGQSTAAANLYRELADATTGWSKSELLYLTAQALNAANDRTHLDLYIQIIKDHPTSYYAKLALDQVRSTRFSAPGRGEGGAPDLITPYQEGRVLYYQRQDTDALEAFLRQQRTLPNHPETPWSRYRAALVYERMGKNDEALEALDTLLRQIPTGEAAEEGLWEKALLLDYLGSYQQASDVYKDFYARFPQSERARDAGFKAGLSHYRAGDMRAAAETWSGIGNEPHGSTNGGRTNLWLAKALTALGDKPGAGKALLSAQDPRPGRYYALRAASLHNGSAVPGSAVPGSAGILPATGAAGVPPAVSSPNYKPLDNTITQEEDAEAQAWLNTWAAQTPALQPTDPRIQRGVLLQDMGLRTEAAQHFRTTAKALDKDAAALYSLARILHDRREYGAAIMAAQAIWEAAPTRNPVEMPRALLKILYPAPYGPLVMQSAKEWKLDPMLLYALMRQESLFNPAATSGATARGLTQVMPATGHDIAKSLRLTSFTSDDLYRPGLSIRLGAYYAAKQLEFLGNPMFALAAYNAGAGSALRWMDNDKNADPDLFLENIEYSETSHYVRIVMENYAYYTRLYANR